MTAHAKEVKDADAGDRGPRHVAIIMDGNGRWAAARGMPRSFGHRQGVESLRNTVRASMDIGVPYLTLYSFSSENWSRPADEVSDLMMLLRRYIKQDLAELHEAGVRIRVIGDQAGVEHDILKMLREAEDLTAANDNLFLTVAFNYGARDEITRAVKKIATSVEQGELSAQEITPTHIDESLDTAGVPDPDLLIRTSGEMRLSNFLLWQCAYTEFVFVDCYWPDFTAETLAQAVEEYRNRDRRYGGVVKRTMV